MRIRTYTSRDDRVSTILLWRDLVLFSLSRTSYVSTNRTGTVYSENAMAVSVLFPVPGDSPCSLSCGDFIVNTTPSCIVATGH